MADTSPTPARETESSLTILPDIIENFSAIAKDLVEYVKLRTGVDIVPQAQAVEPTPTPTPTPEVSVDVETEKKPKSIFGKILGGITKMFSPKVIIGALAAAGIVAVLASDMFAGFRESFSEFTSNLWDKMKEGFAGIGEWFSNLFSKGGELISNLYDGVAEFIRPFKDRVVEFFTSIGDYISEKFASVTAFFGKFEIFGKQDKPKVSAPPAPPKIKKEDVEKIQKKQLEKEVSKEVKIEEEKVKIRKRQEKPKEELKVIKAEKEEPVAPTKVDSEKQQHLDLFDKYIKVVKSKLEQDDYVGAFEANRYTMLAMKRLTKWADENGDEKDKKIAKYLLDEAGVRHINLKKKALTLQGTSAAEIERIETTRIGKPPKSEEKTEVGKPTQVVSGMEDTKAMIIQHEGKRNKPYKDSLGLWTVGVGHLIGDGKTLPPEWNKTFSDEEVMNLFEEDFAHHKKIAEETPGYQAANEGGKAAFIDLSFNMGKWWPKWPTTKKLLENEQFEDAAGAMKDSKWYSQVGNRAVTITSLVAQAGDGRGEQIASGSNEVAITKRSMSKPQTPVVVNTPKTVNNNIVNNDIIPQAQDKTSTSNSLVARMT
jgi:lysozyme